MSSELPLLDKAQQEAVMLPAESRSALIAGAGSGKCLGRGTPVLKFDGTVVPVENIVAGDLLMGPDSSPREVITANSGTGPLYRVRPVKGDVWVCNDDHVMTLINSVTSHVTDISVKEYLSLSPGCRFRNNSKLLRTGVSFTQRKTTLDPYLLGVWLGDGTLESADINTPEPEIRQYCAEIAAAYSCESIETQDTRSPGLYRVRFKTRTCARTWGGSHSLILSLLREFGGLGSEKFIHRDFLVNDEETRLSLLAGLLDTDGHLDKGCYEIVTKFGGLRDDILFLARSLGFAAYTTRKVGTIKSLGFSGMYWRILISGDVGKIPCRVARKKAGCRLQKKSVLRTGFSLEPVGVGEYFGFTLNGDGRFLLGDFTVTHNTTVLTVRAAIVRKKAANRDGTVLCLSYTNKAADEIGHRLIKLLSTDRAIKAFAPLERDHPGMRQRFWNGTLHSFAKHVIEEITRNDTWWSLSALDRQRLSGVSSLYEACAHGNGRISNILDESQASVLWNRVTASLLPKNTPARYDWPRRREDICSVWSGRQMAQMIGHLPPAPIAVERYEDAVRHTWDYFDITQAEQAAGTAYQMEKQRQGVCDYDDLLCMASAALLFVPTLKEYYRKNLTHVLVDEAQDISFLDYVFLQSLPGFNPASGEDSVGYTLVGDCQPTGTLVRTPSGSQRIETLKTGDVVITYDVSGRFFRQSGRAVSGVSSRLYSGDLIEATCAGNKSRYTPEHHCIANFDPLRNKYALYLMSKGKQFRIGKCKIDYKDCGSGPVARMLSEKADFLWILDVYDTDEETCIMEQAVAGRYGITELTFQVSGGKDQRLESTLRRAWDMIGENKSRAEECLKAFGRDIRHPMFGHKTYESMKRPMKVRACNLLPGALMLPYEGNSHTSKSRWQPITLERIPYEGQVYSLDVPEEHTYVADMIVSHNCRQEIFDFRAGQPGLFSTLLQNNWANDVHYLSTNYRCASRIITLAGCVAQNPMLSMDYEPTDESASRPRRNAPEGEVLWPPGMHKDQLEGHVRRAVQQSLTQSHDSRVVLIRHNKTKSFITNILHGIPGASRAFEVSTFHSAKGGEWDHVILVGLGRNQFPATPRFWRSATDNIRSESRVLYVGVTRAKQRLDVFETLDGVFYPSIYRQGELF
jgi:superfamily I DNA/RNA helicase